MGNEQLLTRRDLAERWQVSERHILKLHSRGKAPEYLRIGGVIRYKLSAIEEYEKNNKV